MKKISILIPCFNAERWVGQAIRSALDQTYFCKEVIVVDDGSTDGSLGVVRSFGDAIRWETGPNRGGNAARNRLLELATGEWLQYLDADDYLLPDKVAGQLIDGDSDGTDVLFSPVVMEHCSEGAVPRREVLPIPEPHDPWLLLIRWFLPQTGAALWRRRALVAAGGWKPDLPCCQEHDLYFRLLSAGKRFAYRPGAGAVYRQWSTQTVCRRDPLRSFLGRLEVVRHAETFLQAHGELTPARRDAIAHARYECARSVYNLDPAQARAIAMEARRQHPSYRLPPAACFPRSYRLLHRWLGFTGVERIASAMRVGRPATQ